MAPKTTREDSLVQSFFYSDVPLGGFPDSQIRLGVEFEVGGAYEDWGWIVERKVYDPETKKYSFKRIATHRNLEGVLKLAREKLIEEHKARDDVEKCHCGRAMAMYKVIDGKKYPVCMGHGFVGGLGPEDKL